MLPFLPFVAALVCCQPLYEVTMVQTRTGLTVVYLVQHEKRLVADFPQNRLHNVQVRHVNI